MAQLQKVVGEVIVPVVVDGWTLGNLTSTLRSLAAQDGAFPWRISIVDASRTETVERLARAIVPAERLSYSALHLRTGMLSDLLYQGVGSARSRFLTYCMPGSNWESCQLSHLVGAARSSRSDVIVQGGAFRDIEGVIRMIERGDDPCAGSLVLHTSKIYDKSAGWPRGRPSGFAAPLWRSMFLVGGEFFSVPLRRAVVDSTPASKQLMLFSDA